MDFILLHMIETLKPSGAGKQGGRMGVVVPHGGLFIDASREFVAGKNQNQLSDENVAKVVRTYSDRETIDKYSYLATLEEIQENDYNLNIPRYVDTFEEEEEIDLMAVQAERKEIEAEIAKLNEQMDGYLKELGYGA